nr:amidohydrolase [Halobacillus locisalis]
MHDQVVSWRRYLHQIPELSFNERKTSAYISQEIKSNDVFQVQEGVGGYGVTATLENPGPIIGIRADMDALPIIEETNLSFSSKHRGMMHACGHDAHSAILLGVASLLAEDHAKGQLKGTVQLLFQPAEEAADSEGKTGAVHMLESNQLASFDAILALHMCPWKKIGEIVIHNGPSMANNDSFHLIIQGRGGHAGYPHQTNDPIWIATQVLQVLYSVGGRAVNPLDVGTISIGHVAAGHTNNVIPDAVHIHGTVRSYRPEVRENLKKKLHQAASMANNFGGSYQVNMTEGEPALFNHPKVNEIIKKAASHVTIHDEPFGMGSEDFSHFTAAYPGAMFFLGCGTDDAASLHQSNFDIDEACMVEGVAILYRAVHLFLQENQ